MNFRNASLIVPRPRGVPRFTDISESRVCEVVISETAVNFPKAKSVNHQLALTKQ